jgi:glycosyltransferase involved in cell wall biosynthesis
MPSRPERSIWVVCPEIVDLELLEPADQHPFGADVRTVVRLAGKPVGLLRPRAGSASGDARERAVAALERPLSIALAARRLSGDDEPVSLVATVVVCTRDRPDLLEGCLAALAAQDHPSYEILVVDNASLGPETRELADGSNARYVREERPGLDRARNRGLRESTTPIVAFTDDDARPEPGWLSALVSGFGSPDVHAVTGLVLPAELDTSAQSMFEDVYGGMSKGFLVRLHVQAGRRHLYRPERVGVGCNMAFRREVLLEAGGFDPVLDVGTPTGGGGDLDAFQRVLESGAAIVYRPDAVVRHLHRRELPQLRRQLFDNGRGYSAMLLAAHRRGTPRDRRAVWRRYAGWLARWHAERLLRRAVGRERLPASLILAETHGAAVGPARYARSRRDAHCLDADGGTS